MAKPLTVRTLETIKPGPTRREIPDGLLRGLYLVLQPTGVMSWAVRYRHQGANRKLTLGGYPAIGLKEARELASAKLLAVAKGEDPAFAKRQAKLAAKAKPITAHDAVEAVIEAFVERHCKNLRTGRDVERVLRREVITRWQGRRLGDIDRADVHRMLDELVDRDARVQANRLFAYVNKLCRWAVSRGLIHRNPCDGVERPTPEKARARTRVLDDRELALVWRAAGALDWPFAPIIQLLLLTGQRKSEIAEGRWREIDFEAKEWRLPGDRVKNGKDHVVPLAPEAMQIIEGLPRLLGDVDLIFSTNGKTPVSGFSRAKANLDKAITAINNGERIRDWTFHDIRRSVSSGLAKIKVEDEQLAIGDDGRPHKVKAMVKIQLPVIERILNHISGSFGGVAGTYQRHEFEPEKRAALNAWGAHISGLVSSAPAAREISAEVAASA